MATDQRILTLDAHLDDPRAEEASFKSTRTLLEHQLVLWKPRDLIYEYGRTTKYQGCPCFSENGTAEFLRDEKRRTREMLDFLALGRLLVVLVPPPQTFYVGTGEKRNVGTPANPRFQRIVTARSLGELIPGDVTLTDASGASFQVGGGSAFHAFWKAVGDQFNYVATIDGIDSQLLTINGTNRTVAGLTSANDGKVLLLPERYYFGPSDEFTKEVEDLDDEEELLEAEEERIERETDGAFLDALFDLAEHLIEGPSEAIPTWSERFLLPKEAKAIHTVEEAAAKADAALEKVEQARLQLVDIQDWKRLLSGTGKELEGVVQTAFEQLGCSVEEGRPGRADRIVRWRKRTAVVEIKGLAKSAAEKNAAQLEKWVSEHTIESGESPKGILVANAWRSTPLDERKQPPFPDQMLPYSESREHCLLSTTQLLAAVTACTSIKKRDAFLKELFETNGILGGWSWADFIETVSDSASQEPGS